MRFFRKKKPADPALFLAAIPVRNPAVRERELSAGALRLTGPLRRGKLSVYLGIASREKSFDLDALGAQVWRACDGRTNVESLIVGFAQKHRLNIREAEVSVTTFLNTLMRRNLVALVRPEERRGDTEARRRGDAGILNA